MKFALEIRVSKALGVVAFVGVGLAPGCVTTESSSGQTCVTPAGDYLITFTPADGNCPTSAISELTSQLNGVKAKASEACYSKSGSSATDLPQSGCQATLSVASSGTSAGYGATMAMAMTCSDGSKCQQAFTVVYTKQ